MEERRHQLQQERARFEKEQDESTEVILDKKVHQRRLQRYMKHMEGTYGAQRNDDLDF